MTDHGKILSHYESDIGHFINGLIERLFEHRSTTTTTTTLKATTIISGGQIKVIKYETFVQQKFLKFMINLIKYNAAYVASDNSSKALIKMIRYVCALAYQSESIVELELIYEFLNVVLSYSHLPNETLSQFIVILCIGINREELYVICNKIMRNLIGTYLGYDGLTTLHHIVEDEINFSDKLLIRGAVYFLVQSLWGDMINEKTSISANVILPAFKILLNNDMATSPLIALEIANGIHMFISGSFHSKPSLDTNRPSNANNNNNLKNESLNIIKSSEIIYQYTWDLVLDVCDILVSNHLMIVNRNGTNHHDTTNQLRSMILSILKLLEQIISSEINTNTIVVDDVHCGNVDVEVIDDECPLRILFDDECFTEKFFTIFEMATDHLTVNGIFFVTEKIFFYICFFFPYVTERNYLQSD